jgi:hypothetical protein
MSMMRAPSLAICLPCSTAAATLSYRPPSLKLSGVTFKMPITYVLAPT